MNNNIIPVYVGYDPRENLAYEVCKYSLEKHSPGIEVIPLKQQQLRVEEKYWRAADPLSSTEFTFTRFLVPHLTGYEGWAVFCDCDFVWTVDIAELITHADPKYAVMVVKHNHTPSEDTKMDGCKQTQYPRKNWSSMILWNCSHPSNQSLDLELVNTESGQYLHRFSWLQDHEIGELSAEWNWLVGWNKESSDGAPKVYHWTQGGPWFKDYRNCEYADLWWDYCVETSENLSQNQNKSSTAITWVTCLSRDYWNEIGELTLPSWDQLPGEVVIVWDDKPVELGFGKNYNFFKDVAPPTDPWLAEAMGSYKSDRFWKKSRVQIWAARKFQGLVVWLDADIRVDQAMSKQQAINLLHPQDKVAGTLIAGGEWDIDTGVVAFNTKHENFEKFIRKFSLMWYDGGIFKIPMPYDHIALADVAKSIPIATYVTPLNKWKTTPDCEPDHINRYFVQNSSLAEYFTHFLGIDNKTTYSNTVRGEAKKLKSQKEKKK
jgi:hypothetical protein